MQLSDEQQAAVDLAVAERVCVITGGPGVGKTATIKAVVQACRADGMVQCMAPTGKAAKRMSECLGGLVATTIHRALGYNPEAGGFVHCRMDPLPGMTIIVDESTMCDISLLASVLDALRSGARLVLVGDIDQLPSVGPGTAFRDLILSGVVPVARLTKVFRQAEGSRIALNCQALNAGDLPEFEGAEDSDFVAAKPDEIWAAIERIYNHDAPALGLNAGDVQVLTPQRTTENGVEVLNDKLQELLNPDTGQERWTFATREFRMKERVIQTKNNYDLKALDGGMSGVFNGEVGTVIDFRGYGSGERMIVDFGDRKVEYSKPEANGLQLAYALTVHKFQGSEVPAAIVVCSSQHRFMLTRQLLYTAMSRPKQHLWLVGDEAAMAKAARSVEPHERRGRLVERLEAACAS